MVWRGLKDGNDRKKVEQVKLLLKNHFDIFRSRVRSPNEGEYTHVDYRNIGD